MGRFKPRATVRTMLSSRFREEGWRVTKSANVAVCQGRRRVKEAPQALVGRVSGLFMAGVLPPVSFRVLRAIGLCAASPAVEPARMYLPASVTRWYGRELV